MNYLDFRKDNINRGCFNVHSLEASSQAAISTNLSRWVKEGLLIKLRQGWYTFPERTVSFADRMYCANNIYAPSYVSLFTALAYYEMIPESVNAITSVSTLKTSSFRSKAGLFSYSTIKPALYFGYTPVVDNRELPYLIASPEKSLIDLLYLHPEYKTTDDVESLRLDDDFMSEEFNWEEAASILEKISSVALTSRFSIIKQLYK